MPSFAGASEWLNSEPLGPADLRGRVVLVNLLDSDVHQLGARRLEPLVRGGAEALPEPASRRRGETDAATTVATALNHRSARRPG
jgi:hypothetical protein